MEKPMLTRLDELRQSILKAVQYTPLQHFEHQWQQEDWSIVLRVLSFAFLENRYYVSLFPPLWFRPCGQRLVKQLTQRGRNYRCGFLEQSSWYAIRSGCFVDVQGFEYRLHFANSEIDADPAFYGHPFSFKLYLNSKFRMDICLYKYLILVILTTYSARVIHRNTYTLQGRAIALLTTLTE